jgi:hypothetical protein
MHSCTVPNTGRQGDLEQNSFRFSKLPEASHLLFMGQFSLRMDAFSSDAKATQAA